MNKQDEQKRIINEIIAICDRYKSKQAKKEHLSFLLRDLFPEEEPSFREMFEPE